MLLLLEELKMQADYEALDAPFVTLTVRADRRRPASRSGEKAEPELHLETTIVGLEEHQPPAGQPVQSAVSGAAARAESAWPPRPRRLRSALHTRARPWSLVAPLRGRGRGRWAGAKAPMLRHRHARLSPSR